MATLEQLDGENWGDPDQGETNLIRKCRALRRKDLEQFSVEDLRIMIGQSIGLEHIAPFAIKRLKADPFSEGDLYPGDLLAAFLREANGETMQSWSLDLEVICSSALGELNDLTNGYVRDDRFVSRDLVMQIKQDIRSYLNR